MLVRYLSGAVEQVYRYTSMEFEGCRSWLEILVQKSSPWHTEYLKQQDWMRSLKERKTWRQEGRGLKTSAENAYQKL